jgi:ABC transport system ATP-binding/permease protein
MPPPTSGSPVRNGFFIRRGGRVIGPFDTAKVRTLEAQGKIGAGDEWSRDRVIWSPLESLPESDSVCPPLPPPEPAVWKYSVDGGQAGPVTMSALASLVASGRVPPTALVWKPGLSQWTPVSQLPELMDVTISGHFPVLADTTPVALVGTTNMMSVPAVRAAAPPVSAGTGRGVAIQACAISVKAGDRCLLDDVSLSILPGELCGLMGPSGAGKSTLMNALNGYKCPQRGQVLINGVDLYRYFDSFRGLIGFVPQDDIMHSDLTVNEALFHSARLRLPDSVDDSEIRVRIGHILTRLGLTGAGDVLIGSPTRKGISGGQRKRVNLAMELLTDPAILFLDEPTSGLSSEDTLIVLQVLRDLARSGKTILLTIHQPSLEAFRLMDLIAIVSKDPDSREPGRLAYFGRAYPDSIRFFTPRLESATAAGESVSPDLLLRGLKTKRTAEWCEAFRRSTAHAHHVAARSAPVAGAPLPPPASTSAWSQFRTLVARSLSIKRRDIANTAILLVQAPVIAMLIVLVFGNKTNSTNVAEKWAASAQAVSVTMFLLSLSSIWFGCSNSVREIVGERPIFERERMVTLSLSCYVAAKFAFLGLLCVLQCMLLLAIVYSGCRLEGDWWPMAGILSLSSICGVAVGLSISAIAKSSEVAIAALPLVLLPMVILGGVLKPRHEMDQPMKSLSSIMPSRWAFEGVILVESRARPLGPETPFASVRRPSAGDGNDNSVVQPPFIPEVSAPKQVDVAERYFPAKVHRAGAGAAVFHLILATLVPLAATVLCLRRRAIG